ncbi:uncharacterized protein LOC125861454 [Solanum stenotomum]|uniref:uncharacterized protein LOC125861454 n=1 Tax=Solanum stenotomum TaxID=172797 RepID=UPI0020D022D1|nr:uncharacterized protein LOC125861454 [Solanum stenotomum]
MSPKFVKDTLIRIESITCLEHRDPSWFFHLGWLHHASSGARIASASASLKVFEEEVGLGMGLKGHKVDGLDQDDLLCDEDLVSELNGGGTLLLDFTKAFELVIANSCFPKKENHVVTFRGWIAKTQIDYLLLRKGDRGLYKDCKVIPSENLTTQHKLLVMDLEINRDRRKKIVFDIPRIKWGGLEW